MDGTRRPELKSLLSPVTEKKCAIFSVPLILCLPNETNEDA